jgi:protein-S-isoprenylcysteine O-methyltransferase Ste14
MRSGGPWDGIAGAAAALWFSVIGVAVMRSIIAAPPPELSALPVVHILSKLCLLSFVVMIAFFTLVRGRAMAEAQGLQPRVTAFLGTNLILLGLLLLRPREDLTIGLHLCSAALIAAGNGLAVFTLSFLGRSFSINAEARTLVSTGPYKVVRHPLYLSEQIAVLGVFLQYVSIPALALVIVHFACQVTRIRNEEKLLRSALPGYAGYAARTARLLPGVW